MELIEFDYYLLEYVLSFINPYELYISFETCKRIKNVITRSKILKTFHPIPEFYLKNINNLLWAVSHPTFKFKKDIFRLALRYGDMEVVKYIYKVNRPKLNGTCYYSETIYNENYNMFRWLYKKGFILDENSFNAAAEIGDLNLLKYLEQKDCEWSENAVEFAIKGGNLECVKYLIDIGFIWSSDVYNIACNNLEILKYLIGLSYNDLSKPWINNSVFRKAAEIGNVKVCALLKKYNCLYDLACARIAFENGNVPVLKWFIKNNYPVEQSIINKIK